MLNNIRVGTRLIAGFLAVSLLGAIVGAIGIRNMGIINDRATALYEREVMGISHIKEANINLIYVGRAISSMLLASNAEEKARFREQITASMANLHARADRARPLFISAEGKQIFERFDAALASYDKEIPELLKRIDAEALQDENDVVKYYFSTVRQKANVVDDLITDLSKRKEQNAADMNAETDALYASGRLYMLLLVAGSLGAGIALGVVVTRSITRPLGEAVLVAQRVAAGDLSSRIAADATDELGDLLRALRDMNGNLVSIVTEVRGSTETIAAASAEVATGSMDLSSRTEEQASSLEETASSMEELTSTVKQNADNARQANQLAVSASEVARRGGGVVAQVVDTMQSISESSSRIVDIIGVIDGIAFQTNILALNAAVEAARAGEQGRGFAVVATEVRNLAHRSAAAAKEIKGLIDTSAAKVADGSQLVQQAGSTMNEVVESVQRVTDIMSEISAASQEQTLGIEQINQAVAQMDQVTQQNAALVEEAAAAADSMRHEAGNLERAVSVFQLEPSSGQRTTARPAAATPRRALAALPA